MSTSSSATGSVLLAPSKYDFSKYDLMYYLKGAASGGICCSITHGALTPVDVVKTRVQLEPTKVCHLSSHHMYAVSKRRMLTDLLSSKT